MSSSPSNRREIDRRDFLISTVWGATVVATPWLAGCGPTEPSEPVALPENHDQSSKEAGVSQNFRLTLSVLLAYREKTLERADMEDIARKLGDSASAQEVNQRIDNVIEARADHLAMADGMQMQEPNLVAEYIEGELDPARLKDFELLCLQNDSVLAEVATCYRVLAAVLRLQAKQHGPLGARIKKVLAQKIEIKDKPIGPPLDYIKPGK
jgi:hypothetical protein